MKISTREILFSFQRLKPGNKMKCHIFNLVLLKGKNKETLTPVSFSSGIPLSTELFGGHAPFGLISWPVRILSPRLYSIQVSYIIL